MENRTDIEGLVSSISLATSSGSVTNVMVARVLQYCLDALSLCASLSDMSNLQVSSSMISPHSVSAGHLADGAVTEQKLSSSLRQTLSEIESRLSSMDRGVVSGVIDCVADVLSFLSGMSSDDHLHDILANLSSQIASVRPLLSAEQSDRESADAALQALISAEQTARESADAALQSLISAEQTAREATESRLQSGTDAERTARESADAALQSRIDAERAARESADGEERALRTAADAQLQDRLAFEQSARESADTEERTAREASYLLLRRILENETVERQTSDAQLQGSIASEASLRKAADLDLRKNVTICFDGLVGEVALSGTGTTVWDGVVFSTFHGRFIAFRTEGGETTYYTTFADTWDYNDGSHPHLAKIYVLGGEGYVYDGSDLVALTATEAVARRQWSESEHAALEQWKESEHAARQGFESRFSTALDALQRFVGNDETADSSHVYAFAAMEAYTTIATDCLKAGCVITSFTGGTEAGGIHLRVDAQTAPGTGDWVRVLPRDLPYTLERDYAAVVFTDSSASEGSLTILTPGVKGLAARVSDLEGVSVISAVEMDTVLGGPLPVFLSDADGHVILDDDGKPIEIID